MKKEKENEIRAKSPDRLILKLASGHPVQNGQWIQSQPTGTQSPFLWRIYPSNGADYAKAFVSLQGQGSGFTIGKGPPGLSPDTGGGAGRDPDNKAGPSTGKAQSKNTLQSNNAVLSINKKQNSNFLQLLILKIMKKQIFIFVMALFALGLTKSYGQVLAPRAVTCLTADALHPVAGTAYTYSINVPTPAGTKAYTWFVTQEKNFIAAGVLTPTRELNDGTGTHVVSTGVGYNNATTGVATLAITWKTFAYDAANPVFVVIQATNDDGTGCTTQNMKVYKIQPQNSFTLDLDNLTTAGAQHTPLVYGDNYNVCISNIVSATYDITAPDGVLYDYGVNTFLYEVVAANFSTAWTPSVQLTGINAEESVTVEWSKDKTFATGVTTMTGSAVGTAAVPAVYTSAANVSATIASGTVGVAGESIFIRVTLDHSVAALNYEGLTDEPFQLAVNGLTAPTTGTPEPDIHYQAGATLPAEACPWNDGYTNDFATQTLLRRPDVVSTTVGVAPNPNPGLFLPVKP